MAPLMCDACGREIKPGDLVDFVGGDDDQRIFTSDEVLVKHHVCPGTDQND